MEEMESMLADQQVTVDLPFEKLKEDFDLKDAGKKAVVVLSTDAKKIKASMSNLIKSEKKLAGIMKIIDKNDSNALCEAEFQKLCRQVLKKDQSVKPTPELFHMLWSDVYRLCKDPSQTELVVQSCACGWSWQ